MSKKFIITILGIFVVVGGGFFILLGWGSELPTAKSPAPATTVVSPTPLPPPTVSVTEEDAKTGNIVLIQWKDLPGGATELEVFRSPKGKDQWSLWETISLTADELSSGSASFNIGNVDYDNYDFYTEAVGSGGNGNTVTVTSTLWNSNPSTPVVMTVSSTASNPPSSGNPSTSTSTPTTTPSTTNNQPPAPTNPTTTLGTTTPSGTPYYNPQVQILSYGQNPTANFWVQHVEGTIQIGWQNLPSITTDIVISRSSDEDGPWSPILTQTDPGETGSYSIRVVDNTVDQPYYYLMDADAGTTTVGTYGPFYLPPVSQ